MRFLLHLLSIAILLAISDVTAAETDETDETDTVTFLETHCFECHDSESQKGKLDLTALSFDETSFGTWVKVHERVMFDLVRLALETDSTRIVTVCLNTGTLTPRQIPGVKTMCHELTHHGNREDRLGELRLIEDAQFSALGEFLKGMDAAKEQSATLLDQTAVLYGTNMGSANSHANDNLPVLLAGGGFKHAGHLAFDKNKNYPLTNLYVSLLQSLGVETTSFSSGTGTMRGIEFS